MEKKIYLTDEELNQLKYLIKEVGHGSDGRVFPYKKEYLIKLYRKALSYNSIFDAKNHNNIIDDDDVDGLSHSQKL